VIFISFIKRSYRNYQIFAVWPVNTQMKN